MSHVKQSKLANRKRRVTRKAESSTKSWRAEFLRVRMAYLAELRDEGESEEGMIRAINVDDHGQVPLLLMTWDAEMARARASDGDADEGDW